ncbi:MAG: Bug family tripartite tricarboxylate transporter substrate binding protein [Burkholderiales bacterium]
MKRFTIPVLAVLVMSAAVVHAQQAYPSRAVSLIVPSAPGGTTDFTARLLADLLSGQVAMFNTTPPSVIGHVRAGKLRALAYLAGERHPTMKDIPTSAESGMPGYEVESWFALFTPTGTPPAVIERLGSELSRIVESPEIRRNAEEQGAFARFMAPAALDAYVLRQIETWGRVIKIASIKLDP